ncbi:MAG: hypothetical protein KCHDKBKB_00910 [Elusimicrobia bacterium]|nr:hypothetical protein [Elusimicrobiota bacterium]
MHKRKKMTLTKKQVMKVIEDFPQSIEFDELIYRLYLKVKIENAEEDIRKGRTIPHAKAVKEIEKWFQSGGRANLALI